MIGIGRHTLLFASIMALLCTSPRIVRADAGVPFRTVAVAEVVLYNFMIESGAMVPVQKPWSIDDGDLLQSKAFPFPLDRHFVIGFKFQIEPGASSGYGLTDREGIRVTVNGHDRHVWRDFYLHGRTYVSGKLTRTASAWKFVTLDFVCDPTDVDVVHRGRRLKRVRINGQCPE